MNQFISLVARVGIPLLGITIALFPGEMDVTGWSLFCLFLVDWFVRRSWYDVLLDQEWMNHRRELYLAAVDLLLPLGAAGLLQHAWNPGVSRWLLWGWLLQRGTGLLAVASRVAPDPNVGFLWDLLVLKVRMFAVYVASGLFLAEISGVLARGDSAADLNRVLLFGVATAALLLVNSGQTEKWEIKLEAGLDSEEARRVATRVIWAEVALIIPLMLMFGRRIELIPAALLIWLRMVYLLLFELRDLRRRKFETA